MADGRDRRDTLEVYKDIIDVIRDDDEIISRIGGSAHVNIKRLRDHLKFLVSRNLVEKTSEEPEKWKATDRGLEYCEILEELKKLLDNEVLERP
jgi:predicted transcriptional regulator